MCRHIVTVGVSDHPAVIDSIFAASRIRLAAACRPFHGKAARQTRGRDFIAGQGSAVVVLFRRCRGQGNRRIGGGHFQGADLIGDGVIVFIHRSPVNGVIVRRGAHLRQGRGGNGDGFAVHQTGDSGFTALKRGAVISLGSAAGFDRQGGFFHRQGSLHQCQVGIGARHVDPVFIEDVHFQPVFADARIRPAAGNGTRPGIVPEEPALCHLDSAAGKRRAVVRLAEGFRGERNRRIDGFDLQRLAPEGYVIVGRSARGKGIRAGKRVSAQFSAAAGDRHVDRITVMTGNTPLGIAYFAFAEEPFIVAVNAQVSAVELPVIIDRVAPAQAELRLQRADGAGIVCIGEDIVPCFAGKHLWLRLQGKAAGVDLSFRIQPYLAAANQIEFGCQTDRHTVAVVRKFLARLLNGPAASISTFDTVRQGRIAVEIHVITVHIKRHRERSDRKRAQLFGDLIIALLSAAPNHFIFQRDLPHVGDLVWLRYRLDTRFMPPADGWPRCINR